MPTLRKLSNNKAFVKPINEIEYADVIQVRAYYHSLRSYYNTMDLSRSVKLSIYKEIKDIEYFFSLLGQELNNHLKALQTI